MALLEELGRQVHAELQPDAPEADPEQDRRFMQQLDQAEERANQLRQQMRLQLVKHAVSAARLRTALLARLCALGADLPAAEAQLRASHPDLERQARAEG